MQRPLAYIFQTLFQYEVFVIMPTLNAGSRYTSCLSWQHDKCFLNFLYKPAKIDETWTLLNTELSIYKIYKVGILFCFLRALF
jgi:hypothetical protein